MAILALFVIVLLGVAAAPATPDVAILVYLVLSALVAVGFGAAFLLLRLTTGGATTYWCSASDRRQLFGIIVLILVAVFSQLVIAKILEMSNQGGTINFAINSVMVMTAAPALFLIFGVVRWPVRLRQASRLHLLLIGGLAVGLAAFASVVNLTYAGASWRTLPFVPVSGLLASLALTNVGEEIIFRVLLLTALADATRSRVQSVFLSSTIFAASHAPMVVFFPILKGNRPLLAVVANAYGFEFIGQLVIGLLLGVLWLRTGSLWVIGLTHFVFNIGPALRVTFGL